MDKKLKPSINIEPLYDNYLVAPVEAKKEAKGGVILPDNSTKDQPMLGEIKAVPSGDWYEKGKKIEQPVIFKVGEKVYYRKWSVTEIEKDKLVVVNQRDIVARHKE